MSRGLLDARLSACAELVRQGAVFADVGTDHAYLPIFLLSAGRIERAVLSDINEGPLLSAKENVEAHGFSDKVELVLTDGATELTKRGITDYAVCGMGGELIADIVASAPHLRDPDIRLILQPMTRQEALRTYLYSAGYEILSERYAEADGRFYLCMHVAYSGEMRELGAVEAMLGVSPIEGGHEGYLGYLRQKAASISAAAAGRCAGGLDVADDTLVLRAIEKRIELISEQQTSV